MVTAVLKQRLRVPTAHLRDSGDLDGIISDMTLKQRQLSPLSQPGTLKAYAMDESDLLLPKYWALANLSRLGVDTVIDQQFQPATDVNIAAMQLTLPHGLRPHQQEALDNVIAAFRDNAYGGGACITQPCGFGKSVTALAVAAAVGMRTLIITHTSVLASQWRETILQYCPNAIIGGIVQNTFQTEGTTHVIASLHSLAQRDYAEMETAGFGLLVTDESHHISTVQLSEALNKSGCRFRLGLSATPTRADGLTPFMHWALGDEVFRIKRPPCADLRAYCVRISRTPVVTTTVRGGKSVNMAAMINSLFDGDAALVEARQELVANWIRLCASKSRKCIIVGDRICLLKDLEQRIRTTLTTSFLIGSTKQKDRATAGDAQVIFGSYSICSEGLDIPALDTVLLMTPRSGKACIEQVIGRLMRDGGRSPLVIDFVDEVQLFKAMSQKRIKVYRAMGAKVTWYDELRNVIP